MGTKLLPEHRTWGLPPMRGPTCLVVSGLLAFASAALAETALVQGTQSDQASAVEGATESKYLHRSIERARQLSGLPFINLDDEDVAAGKLRSARIAILPHNVRTPTDEQAAFATLVGRRGKLIGFLEPPSAVLALMATHHLSGDQVTASGMLGFRDARIANGVWRLRAANPSIPASSALPRYSGQGHQNAYGGPANTQDCADACPGLV